MLIDVFDAFLAELSNERALDGPLTSLLWSRGFRQVDFVHGSFEFGKDFVAQGSEGGQLYQFFVQSKGGDITASNWKREVQPQCEIMVRTKNGPPGFSTLLPRRLIVVFNGRFKGQSGILAKEYAEDLEATRQISLQFWNRHRLSELLAEHYTSVYNLSRPKPADFFTDLGAVFTYTEECARGDFTWARLEQLTKRWLTPDATNGFHLSMVETFWLRQLLKQRGLRCHATLVAHGLARLAAVTFSQSADVANIVINLYKRMILQDADEFLSWFMGVDEKYRERALVGGETGQSFSTVVRIGYLMEVCALAVLLSPDSSRMTGVSTFFGIALQTRCVRRPLSEDFAATVPLVCLALLKLEINPREWLEDLANWCCDNAVLGGLPLPRSSAENQVRALGLPISDMNIESSPKVSFLLAALLDTASLLRDTQLYDDIMNDAMAVDLVPAIYAPNIEAGNEQFIVGGSGILQAYGGNYATTWVGDEEWKNAGHHHKGATPNEFDVAGQSWLALAISLLVRDRWWTYSLSVLYAASAGRDGQESVE